MTLSLMATLVCYLLATTITTTASAAASDNVVRSADDLLYDENNKLKSHHLLYTSPANTKCPWDDFFVAPTGFEARPVEGDAWKALFGATTTTTDNDRSNKCQAACIERGVDRSLTFDPMPHKFYPSTSATADFGAWFVENCRKVEVCVMNYHSKDHPMNLYWRQPETGEWKMHLEIEYGYVQTCQGVDCHGSA